MKSASPLPIQPRILVTGATGFIGQEVVRQLAAGGHKVRVIVRNRSKLPSDLDTSSVEVFEGDLTCATDIDRALSGIDFVYHLARASVKTQADYTKYDVEVTRCLAERAIVMGIKRFIYTGTIDSYYAGAHAGTITEDSPLDQHIDRRNLYAQSKTAQSEAILRQLHRERGLPLVIARPGIVIGRGGSPFHWGVGMWGHLRVCQVWGVAIIHCLWFWLVMSHLALVAMLDAKQIEGESFNLIGDPLFSAKEYLDELDRAGGFCVQRHCVHLAALM